MAPRRVAPNVWTPLVTFPGRLRVNRQDTGSLPVWIGSTLVELLVVIAIIGILSTVVLVSLRMARSKGSDAAIKMDLSTVQVQASRFLQSNKGAYGVYDNGAGAPAACPPAGTAGATVFHNAIVENAIGAAVINSGGGSAACMSSATAYAVEVSRPPGIITTASAYWCVDSAGSHCGVNAVLAGVSCGACVTSQ